MAVIKIENIWFHYKFKLCIFQVVQNPVYMEDATVICSMMHIYQGDNTDI